ncbi:PLP-dependent aminotransferase family protein [Neptunicella marina]|uniref:PLP-dependent aminotransferase family protein n=1 Tax=Neptunicella marina TaxID=2125989 RepID=A0A8J6LWS8_9ALTE|nr:PLP-dependent aminotransferase family protein [Neptunicella marina]MBC3765309.1 PLP-dependent aminotransferase family protein [Neptunicella marina]
MWNADLSRSKSVHLYQQVVDCLAMDIANQILQTGQRLPTVRVLAQALDVTPGTINKAFDVAEKQGLIEKRQGRGTFVRSQIRLKTAPSTMLTGQLQGCNFTINAPMPLDFDHLINPHLRELAQSSLAPHWSNHTATNGIESHLDAISSWVAQRGVDVSINHLLLVSGAQQGILSCLMLLLNQGDNLMVQECTYPGIKSAASLLGINLRPVKMDEQGLDLAHFEQLCQQNTARILFVMPTAHNPTGRTMDMAHRKKLVAIAKRHQIILIEDDLYLHQQTPPSLQSMLPEQTFYISGFSKCILLGLRVGMVIAPELWRDELLKVIQVQNWMVSPLLTALLERLIDTGVVEQIEQIRKQRNSQRINTAKSILGKLKLEADPVNLHIWLKHPTNVSSADLLLTLQQKGVDVIAGSFFHANNQSVPSLRLCLGNVSDEELQRGLKCIADTLYRNHLPSMMF